MIAEDLVKSFIKRTKWSPYKDKANRPISGIFWLTRKQVNFLHDLWYKENQNTSAHFTNFTWFIDGYMCNISRQAPNGCRQIYFELLNEENN